jgi:sigma-B regulation protein RsbU (phosphoserine phosphatase)
MANSEPGVRRDPRLFRTLHEDVQHIWADFQRYGFKRTIRRTYLELHDFYLDAQAKEQLRGMGRFRRTINLAFWLLTSLFLKLTPARRMLLALSVLFMLQATDVEHQGQTTTISIHFPLLGIATLVLILMLELKDKLVARDELAAGRSVQQALMPETSPQIPKWDVWLFTRSANDVGGDLVDYVPVEPQRFGLALGDVAGKGLPAALLMAKLQSTLRALADEGTTLAALGERMNRILCRDGLPNRFATLVYLEVCAQSGSVRLLNAGHLPPLVLRAERIEELPTGSMALGMLPEATYFEQSVELADGDTLIVFSDGLTEATNDRDEFFGDERMQAHLPVPPRTSAKDIGTRLVAAVDEFVGDARPHDDLSLIVLRRASEATSPRA